MTCMRCGTCHRLMVGGQAEICKAKGHEPAYDDEPEENEEE